MAAIDPAKDVDGFHVVNAGMLAEGEEAIVPCTPLGCLMMLKDELGSLDGLEAVIVGRSNIVGKPMAQLLLKEHRTVTIGRASCRERVCPYVSFTVVAVSLIHNKLSINNPNLLNTH